MPTKVLKENFVLLHHSNLNKALKTPLILHNSLRQESYAIIVTKVKKENFSHPDVSFLRKFNGHYYWLLSLNNNTPLKSMVISSFNLKVVDRGPKFNIDLFPKAHASCFAEPEISSELSSISHYSSDASLSDMVMSCLEGVVQGAWDATGGMLMDGAEYIYDLFTSPMETIEKTKKQFNAAIDAVKNLGQTFDNFKQFFGSLDNSSKAHIICSFIGSFGADALIAILTAGAGSAKLVLSFTNYLKKFSKIQKFINIASKGKSLTQTLPKKFLEKLAKGKIADKVLDTIDRFSGHNMPDLARSTIRCAM